MLAWLLVSTVLITGVADARSLDWLRSRDSGTLYPASATTSPSGDTVKLSNGLVSRTFTLTPNWATVDLSLEQGDRGAGQTFLRGLSPEAKLFLQGMEDAVDVGGLVGEQRFLLWYPQTVNLTADPEAFRYVGHTITKPVARFPWRPQRNSDNASWPPKGVHLAVRFEPPVSDNGTNSSKLTERDNFEIPCQPDQSGVIKCLAGHPQCDNTTVAQQCTLPWATAQAVCKSWPACRALNCKRGKSCQARAHTKGQASAGAVAFVKRAPPFPYPNLRVTVHYELYDGLPAITKWVDVQNIATADQTPRNASEFSTGLPKTPMLAQLTVERVHVPWHLRQRYHCETDFMPQIGVRNSFEDAGCPLAPFGWVRYPASGHYSANFTGLTNPPGNLWRYDTELMGPWGKDDSLHYWYDMGMNETLLEVQYPFGPGTVIASNSTLSSFRTYTILQDSDDLERQSLQRRKMVRTLAPQVTENMLMFYCNTGDSATIRHCADQAAETGFEMLHTHVDPTNLDPAYLTQVKADHDYIHTKGMLTGTYVLLQNPPHLNASTEIIDPETGQPEGIACFATSFHQQFLNTIETFIQATGIDFMDTDGPFEQAPCGSTHHSGHHGLLDSQWAQYSENVAWYQKLKGLDCGSCLCPSCGLYLGVPDPYYFQGGINTEPIGFTDAWGHTADNDEFLTYGRVYQHDGLYWKPPGLGSIGFDTQRAGAQQSTEELRFLETGLVQFFGIAGWGLSSSANAIYKSPAAKALLTKWASWNKAHRRILNADILHVRRPSGRSWDCIGHADPAPPRPGIDPRGLFLFFNPTAHNVSAVFSLPLYYTGAERLANVSVSYVQGGGSVLPTGASLSARSATAAVDLDYEVEVGLRIEAKGYAIATVV